VAEFVALKNLDVKIKKGEFVCLIGDVGSGKSSFLSALIGDLLYPPQKDFAKIESSLARDKSVESTIKEAQSLQLCPEDSPMLITQGVSYVQQTPWI